MWLRLFLLLCVSFLFSCQEQLDEPVVDKQVSSENKEQGGQYKMSPVIAGSSFHGIHGLEQGSDGLIYAGSVLGQAIYQINPNTAEVNEFIPAPEGMADDLTFDKQGNLYWTAFTLGKIYKRSKNGTISLLAEGLPGINSIAFHPDGRLFATRVFLGDALYEIDPYGKKPAREIMSGMGGLNGFDFSEDGFLYGPLWFKGQVVKVDVDKASLIKIADGFVVPSGVEFNQQGELFLSDSAAGKIYRINPHTGETTLISEIANNIDNLTIGSQGQIYVSNMTDNAIIELTESDVDKSLFDAAVIVQGRLASPAGIMAGEDYLYIADTFSLRRWSYANNAIEDIERLVDKHHYPMMLAENKESLLTSSWFTGTLVTYDKSTLEQTAVVNGLLAPYGLYAFDDGSVLVAEYAKGCLTQIINNKQSCLLDQLQGPVGIAVANNERVYISEQQGGKVSIYNLKTKSRSVLVDNLHSPEGIALDGQHLIIAEVGQRRLLRIALSDSKMSVVADNLPLGLPASKGSPEAYVPTGVSVKDGEIYVSSDIENAVYKFSLK